MTRKGALSSQFEELQMFMTPKEIKSKYQPLDADRLDHDGSYEEGSAQMRTNTLDTAQSAMGGRYNTPGGRARAWSDEGPSRSRVVTDKIESDEQLWDRKLEEAQWERPLENPRAFERTGRSRTTGGRSNYPDETGGTWSGSEWKAKDVYSRHAQEESLYESIERGGVQKPISLGQTIGSQGKPEIVGGHHRLAAASAINPDQFVPVLHFNNIWEAKKGAGGYKYT